MTKIPKRPSYNRHQRLPTFSKHFPIHIMLYPFLFCLVYGAMPLYLARQWHIISGKALFIFYLINGIIAFVLLQHYLWKKYRLRYQFDNLQEKMNIAQDEHRSLTTHQLALAERIKRYRSLKEIIEQINSSLALEIIANHLTTVVFSLLAGNRGTCILYLVDPHIHTLSLFKTKKEDPSVIIKTKEGDIFDLWVLRHSSPLLVQNSKDDFRFDLERIPSQEKRPIGSLIAAPLISENKFMGLLRLENLNEGFYSLDDLRLLSTIADVGAVALENGELFQKTQDLAIHDSLTALYTKGYFLERLKEEHKRSLRQQASFSLLMLDIDYFKKYNDAYGHVAGDRVLKMLGETMFHYLKGFSAIISRFGGEEFCVILPGIDKKGAHEIAEGLRLQVEKTKVVLRRKPAAITVSIGVANFPMDSSDEEELIFKADKAMYEAKEKGRNRVV